MFQKYSIFWSMQLGHFIKYKLDNSNEYIGDNAKGGVDFLSQVFLWTPTLFIKLKDHPHIFLI